MKGSQISLKKPVTISGNLFLILLFQTVSGGWSYIEAVPFTNQLLSMQNRATCMSRFQIIDPKKTRISFSHIEDREGLCNYPPNACLNYVIVIGTSEGGDFSCNSRRGFIALLSSKQNAAYNLYDITTNQIIRRPKWNDVHTGIR